MRKYLFLTAAFLLSVFFTVAQSHTERSSAGSSELMGIYHRWKNAVTVTGNSASARNARMTTSLFYPAKATNYNWSTLNSNWNFSDTTLYTYAGPGLVSSATRKDNLDTLIARTLTSYDTSDRVIESIYQTWSAGWLNIYRDTFVFDSYNQTIRHEYQTWGGSQWNIIGGDQFQNTYNGAGKILVQVVQTWNGMASAWINSTQKTNTYNTNDQITQTIAESWNTSTLNWQNTSQTDYTYDVSNINTQTVFKIWNGSAFVNFNQTISVVWDTWTGDIATSRPQSYIFQTWNGSVWVNSQRLVNATYDSFGGSIELFHQYISGSWVNDARNSVFFDTQFNKTGARDETWNIPVGAWDTTYEYRYLYMYDANFSITESIYQQYDNGVHAYVNYTKAVYTDFLFLSVLEINPEEKISVAFYPNPMTDFSDVIILSENFNPVSFQVYDVSGKMILNEANRNKNFRLHKNKFSAGIYLLMISGAAGETAAIRFIVQ
ncbi:MAG TPA: T9SS type A sorting domain-containing protein [Bacteroidia bacterium]|nr:T9SS type A sorting domain-containing protein [Bacteroidia bacterium]